MKRRRLHASIFAIILPAIAQLYYRGSLFDSDGAALERKEPNPKKVEKQELHHNVTRLNALEEAKELTRNKSSAHKEEKQRRNDDVNNTNVFQVKDLDCTRRASCGWEKCYFQSRSDSHVGYLLAPTTKTTKKRFKSLEESWKLAEHLKREYNITHFLLAPPTKLTVTKQVESRLNQNLWSERYRRNFGKRYKRFRKGHTVVVQKVKPAPKQKLLIGCKKTKLKVFEKLVDKFILKIKHKKSFAQLLKESFASTRKLLHKEPCLALDFQVFLDTSGNVYHLDFDRCFNTKTAKKKRVGYKREQLDKTGCYKTLEKIERRIYRALKKSSQ